MMENLYRTIMNFDRELTHDYDEELTHDSDQL